MDRSTYHQMKVLSAMSKLAWQMRKHVMLTGAIFQGEIGSFRSDLRHLRQNNSPIPYNGLVNRKRIISSDTHMTIKNMYKNTRKYLFIYVGDPPRTDVAEGSRNTKNSYNLYVSWLWKRKVYEKLYSKQQLDANSYFVLRMDEYRTNHPYIRLYEARVYDFREDKVLTMWVGQSGVGAQKATLKSTSSDAIKAAKSLYESQINADLTGQC